MRSTSHRCPGLIRAVLPVLLVAGAVRVATAQDGPGPSQVAQVGALEDDGRPAVATRPAAVGPSEASAPSVTTAAPTASRPAEVPGPAPGPGMFWVAGTYVPNGSGVVWRPGFWAAGQPGWDWVPARWVQGATGPAFVEGRWERVSTSAAPAAAPAAWPSYTAPVPNAVPPAGRVLVRPRTGPGAAVSRLLNGNRFRAQRGRR